MNEINLRKFAILDTETDGTSATKMPWEIAVIFKATDLDVWMEHLIHVSDFDPTRMSDDAARINGFNTRWLSEPGAVHMTEREASIFLERILTGRRIVGSKPSFDQDALTNLGCRETWEHHYRDVPSMFLGAYGYEVKGLAGVLDALGIKNEAPHTALGDARATRDAFVRILDDAGRL